MSRNFSIIISIWIISISLYSCRAGNSIQILNSTKEQIEITYCLMDQVILAERIKEQYGNRSNITDSLIQTLKQEQNSSSKNDFAEMYGPEYGQTESFINVYDDTTKGCRSFTLLPKSKVVLAYSEAGELCEKDGNICPYLGSLIVKYKNNVIYKVENEGVRNLLKYKVEWPAQEVYYLEIQKKDLEAYSKTPKTE